MKLLITRHFPHCQSKWIVNFTLYASQSDSSTAETETGTTDETTDGKADRITDGTTDPTTVEATGETTEWTIGGENARKTVSPAGTTWSDAALQTATNPINTKILDIMIAIWLEIWEK